MTTNLKHKHPFIDGLKTVPENRKKDFQKIRSWLITQPHLPQISDDFVYLFLHACYYSQDKTKACIECYFSMKSNSPILFENRDAYDPKMQTVMGLGHLIRLPELTPEGYRVLMYTVKDPDPVKFNFNDAVKGFCMYNDCVLSEDGLTEGYVILFDMKGVAIGHLARVSLPALKAFMLYIQNAHPVRLKAIHVLNTASWIHHIMRMIVPLIKSELLNMVKFHKGNTPEEVPLEILPKEYGGEAPNIAELDNQTKSMVDKYADWLKETEELRTDESKRKKKDSWWGIFSSAPKTPLDKETFLKNLQID